MKNFRGVILISAASFALLAAGCTKKHPVQAATPPAPAAAPAERPQERAAQPSRPTTPPQQEAAATPSRRLPDAATRKRIDELLGRIEDAYFDYNQHTLRPDAVKALQADSTELRDIIVQYPDYHLTIEGHADERGSEEYNLALGDARAKAAKSYLVQVGIPDAQLSVVSYGKDKPSCEEHDEACWQKNRRIHIVAAPAR
ncbi:MAG TPA: OmpA family protein [Bryobacteraceae bacterium]|jgi:peptidoglycan-associated lipoprotein|nr:OmpA family protein [Bryobacteraceae bacterium]